MAIVIEYMLFIYYADTLFYRKKNKYLCYGIIAIGYLIHFVTCAMGNIVVNTVVSIGMYMFCFLLCYHIEFNTAIFQTAMLILFMFADEWVVATIPYFNISFSPIEYSPQQSLILTVISRLLYISEIMYICRAFCKKQKNYKNLSIMLVTVPIVSVAIVWMLMYTVSQLTPFICVLLVIINIIAFAVDQKMFRKELETATLKEQIAKESIDYEEYTLLSEKYEQTRIFRHDLKEHLSILNTLIDENPENAKAYIKSIYDKEENMQFTRFSNNKILNILLSKKKGECVKREIEFLIEPIQADLGFISDMDTVTLFSNLINNAIESSTNSVERKICLNISTINENFVVIKIINTCGTKPVVINSKLRTSKDNATLHGIGMNSIKRAIKNYDGCLKWNYDDAEKVFNTTVIINTLTAWKKK